MESPDERTQFNGILLTIVTSHMNLRELYLQGYLQSEFILFENDLGNLLLCPGARQWWADLGHAYLHWGDYIDELIAKSEGTRTPYTESLSYLRMTP